MFSGKKVTREDTWRPDDLIKHIRSQEEESKRRERSHREPERERSRHREESGGRGEARDERERESRTERERGRGETEFRDREKEQYKDRNRERERDRDGLRERVKERNREKGFEKEERNRERDRDRNRERDKEMDREREKRDRDRLREKDKTREARRERGQERDREKDRERERRRAERERERRNEKEVSVGRDNRLRERERDKKERYREREHGGQDEEQRRERRDHERREKHRQHAEHADRDERRERRRREKEQNENREKERRHRPQEGDGVREREERENVVSQTHGEQEKKTQQEVGQVKEVECNEAEDYGNEDYEDDFEDYEEDFEELDEEEEEVCETERREAERELSPHSRREVEDIRRAMEKENKLVGTAQATASTPGSDTSHRASADSEGHSANSRAYGRIIDFTAASQREKNQQVADKHKNRSAELLRLIDLDFSVTESLLDIPPVREYDLYIKSYGIANTKQVYVQCNEDNIERDTQTEETDLTDKWTQHPPETSVACGGPQVSQNASVEYGTGITADSKRLNAFLRSATQVMAVLLEENIAENNLMKMLLSQTHTCTFSDGCVHLNTELNFLQGRQVTLLHFSQTQTHTLLSVHALCSSSIDVTLDSKTLICVWNIWEPSTPQKILVYEAEVRSCCFSPGKASLLFAGTDVGSVLVWDLREHSGSHPHIRVCEDEWTLRYPTFSTDAVLARAGHLSSVVSVEPVLVNMGAGLRDPLVTDQEESLGLSFQLGSLDENGLLNLWVVVELSKADESGSQTDLGLRPGGKVKLLHSASVQTVPPVDKDVMGFTSQPSFVLKFLPSDSNHYFIGTNMGLVRHGTRHGLRAVPKLYRSKDGERAADVTALEFCPTGEAYFLVGCTDGSVRLHSLACEEAVCEWAVGSGGALVQCVRFSPTRCSVFCSLDSTSVLNIWDLTQRDDSAFITQDLHTDPISAMAVFGDASKQNPYSGIALAKHSGRLEIHFLLPSLTLPQSSDSETLHSLAHDTL